MIAKFDHMACVGAIVLRVIGGEAKGKPQKYCRGMDDKLEKQ